MDSQPLSKAIWDDQVQKNFKSLLLVSFNGKTNPWEHIIAINNLMEIVGSYDSLKCKLITGTFKEGALRWFMSLPDAQSSTTKIKLRKWYNIFFSK